MTTAEATATREIPYVSAINEALRQVMREDPDVFLAGEDVGLYGGVFGTSRGLLDEFGPNRVIDTPISESGIVGMAVGAAATGLRPVIEIMFMDFVGVCMDQIVNQAAKMKYMFGGKARLPITIRTMAGGGMSMAAQHSQSLEAWFCHVPGLKVVMPSTPYDAKGLLVAAIRDDNPVIVVEQKLSLGLKGPVPEEIYEVPIGKASVVRPVSTSRSSTPAPCSRWTPRRSSARSERRIARSSSTRRCASAASAARSRPKSRRRRSTTSMRPSAAWGLLLRRSRSARHSRSTTCRPPRRSSPKLAASSGSRFEPAYGSRASRHHREPGLRQRHSAAGRARLGL